MLVKLIKNLFVIIFFSILLTSCAVATHIKFKPEDKQGVKTISIDPNIKKPDEMFEMNRGQSLGLIGNAIIQSIENRPMPIKELIKKNNIDIQKIVYQKWIEKLNAQSRFKINSDKSDTRLITEIVGYGISNPPGFTSDYVPTLVLNAKLVRNNKIIWQDGTRVMWPKTSGMPSYNIQQIYSDPKKLSEMWEKAADKIITDMVNDMTQ